MNHAANTQSLVSNCRHARLRAALQFPGQVAPAKTVEAPAAVPHATGFTKKVASLMLVAVAYFFFAALATVDYSAWEAGTESGEIAICQTSEDGRVTIVTVPTQS